MLCVNKWHLMTSCKWLKLNFVEIQNICTILWCRLQQRVRVAEWPRPISICLFGICWCIAGGGKDSATLHVALRKSTNVGLFDHHAHWWECQRLYALYLSENLTSMSNQNQELYQPTPSILATCVPYSKLLECLTFSSKQVRKRTH